MFVKERALEFADIKDKINPNDLVMNLKLVKTSQKILEIMKCQ